jgi:hypothetical protein
MLIRVGNVDSIDDMQELRLVLEPNPPLFVTALLERKGVAM